MGSGLLILPCWSNRPSASGVHGIPLSAQTALNEARNVSRPFPIGLLLMISDRGWSAMIAAWRALNVCSRCDGEVEGGRGVCTSGPSQAPPLQRYQARLGGLAGRKPARNARWATGGWYRPRCVAGQRESGGWSLLASRAANAFVGWLRLCDALVELVVTRRGWDQTPRDGGETELGNGRVRNYISGF